MTASLSLTESQTLTALRAFLLAVLPSGIEVIQGQANRVAEPFGNDFVVMTPTQRVRLETNTVTYDDPYPTTGGSRFDLMPTQVTVQLDIHGPAGAENTQIIATLFRSEYAVDQFAGSGFDVTPLYVSDPHQMPFLNGENQYENRWVIDAVMQANPIVTTAQQFAGTLTTGIIDVDEAYPPA
jgi:hypothetical protein